MSARPLHLPKVPMAGPDGRRNNLVRLRAIVGEMLPPRGVLIMEVTHEAGCPCVRGHAAIEQCTCATVDLTLRLVDPRAS